MTGRSADKRPGRARAGGGPVLSARALNRALLARQHLLRRTPMTVPDMVEHLVGLQAQATMPPYIGLWSRLEDFDPEALGGLLEQRALVRLSLMRNTIHMVTARDAPFLRGLVQPAIDRSHRGTFGRRTGPLDFDALGASVRELLASGPLTARELAERLPRHGAGDDVEALASAIRTLPLVQVTPRGIRGAGGQARYATLEQWTGSAPDEAAAPEQLVLRYLRAFGPASVADAQAWSGLTRLREVFERLRGRLATFRDGNGRELFDLPDAPRPDPAVAAPVRLLGQYDNALLAHADRSRIVPASVQWTGQGLAGGRWVHNLLVDGMLAGIWWMEEVAAECTTLVVLPFADLPHGQRREVEAEAGHALAALAPDAPDRAVRFQAPSAPAPVAN